MSYKMKYFCAMSAHAKVFVGKTHSIYRFNFLLKIQHKGGNENLFLFEEGIHYYILIIHLGV